MNPGDRTVSQCRNLADEERAERQPDRVTFNWYALFALIAITLVVAILLTGCVSQGEYNEALAKIETLTVKVDTAERLRLGTLQDLAEAEACIDWLLEYIDADERRTRRYLFGGAR